MIEFPARIEIARLPTPLQRLRRWSERLGVDLWIKRDDLTGTLLSGNKIRKLEFHFAEMRRRGADTIVTCGGIQSNHARAAAAAARRVGADAYLLLRGTEPAAADEVQGNLLLDRLMGARVRFAEPEVYSGDRERLLAEIFDEVTAGGHTPYWTPSGGSDAVGAWGYIAAMDEMLGQFADLGIRDATIVHAVGSGGTTAGLLLGRKLCGLEGIRIAGFNVCDTAEVFREDIPAIANACAAEYGLDSTITAADVEIHEGYVGRGYALSRPEEIRLIAELARDEGVLLDPVYTGKAFYGLVRELERDPRAFGDRVVFLHTGGIYGWFAKSADVVGALEG